MFPPGKDLNFNSSGLDGISRALWKTPLFYAGSVDITCQEGHFYMLFCRWTSKNGPNKARIGGRGPRIKLPFAFRCCSIPRPRAPGPGAIMIKRSITNLSCMICEVRKEKRFCPAVHGRICPQCCGEQREVTLDCPGSCVYLQQARDHEGQRSLDDLDPAALFPQVEIGEQFLYQHEHLIMGLTYALAKAAQADRTMMDADLIQALTSMSKQQETLVNSGLHYETPITSLSQQAVIREVRQLLEEYRKLEQKQLGYSRLHDSDVLGAIVFLLRMGHARTSGRPKSRAFVDFVLSQFPE